MRWIGSVLSVCMLLAALPAAGGSAAVETYDLLFRSGSLDGTDRDATLSYHRRVTNRLVPAADERDSGTISLSFVPGNQAQLEFSRDDGKHRNLGSFPASVGNPMIMYFVETVVRDMAESAGGSPFYIRNRVKESLVRPAETVEETARFHGRTVPAVTVTLRPFSGDPNAARMRGFGDLALTVTMSEQVPGWYLSLRAEAPGAEGGAPVYSSVLTFAGTGQ